MKPTNKNLAVNDVLSKIGELQKPRYKIVCLDNYGDLWELRYDQNFNCEAVTLFEVTVPGCFELKTAKRVYEKVSALPDDWWAQAVEDTDEEGFESGEYCHLVKSTLFILKTVPLNTAVYPSKKAKG